MRIEFLATIEGTCDGVAITAGTVGDIGESSAQDFIAKGLARAVPDQPKAKAPTEVEVETAAVAPSAHAALRIGKATPRKKA